MQKRQLKGSVLFYLTLILTYLRKCVLATASQNGQTVLLLLFFFIFQAKVFFKCASRLVRLAEFDYVPAKPTHVETFRPVSYSDCSD